ncbi:UNVERIFIED_CONTAM: hypothetical protein FKN15_003577 [Acipenser sinensis]
MKMADAKQKRNEQLKRWLGSDTDLEPPVLKKRKSKVKFDDGAVFLAACSSGDSDEVLKLLDRGADINYANVDGLTALHQQQNEVFRNQWLPVRQKGKGKGEKKVALPFTTSPKQAQPMFEWVFMQITTHDSQKTSPIRLIISELGNCEGYLSRQFQLDSSKLRRLELSEILSFLLSCVGFIVVLNINDAKK